MAHGQNPSPRPRPAGISSRITPAGGPRHPWPVGDVVVDLPVVVDWVSADTAGCDNLRIVEQITLDDVHRVLETWPLDAPAAAVVAGPGSDS